MTRKPRYPVQHAALSKASQNAKIATLITHPSGLLICQPWNDSQSSQRVNQNRTTQKIQNQNQTATSG
jgi:hypothetical protein